MLIFINISNIYQYSFTQLNILNNPQIKYLIVSIINLSTQYNILAIHIMAHSYYMVWVDITNFFPEKVLNENLKSSVFWLNVFRSINL